MGREKYIVLENKEYAFVLNTLYQVFQEFEHQYTLIKNSDGFSLCSENRDWSEVMQIQLDVAHRMDYAVLEGENYLYCLFHIGGDETDPLLRIILNTMDELNMPYIMENL